MFKRIDDDEYKRSFKEEVDEVQQILKNSAHMKQAFFTIRTDGCLRELLINKTGLGKIERLWRWVDSAPTDEVIGIVDERKKFEERMDELENDAEFGRKVQDMVSRGKWEIIKRS